MPDTIVPISSRLISLRHSVDTPSILFNRCSSPSATHKILELETNQENQEENDENTSGFMNSDEEPILIPNIQTPPSLVSKDSSSNISSSFVFQSDLEIGAISNKMRLNSFSLDQGLNCIKEHQKEKDLSTTKSEFENSSKLGSVSNSFPDLSSPTADCKVIGSEVSEQTTLFLHSWHQDDPSPYESNCEFLRRSCEVVNEVINLPCDGNNSMKSNTVDLSSNLSSEHLSKDGVSKNGIEYTSNSNISSNVNEIEEPSSMVCNEIGVSEPSKFSEEALVESDDDAFLDDVASRTANLASHHCSFKLSFSKSVSGS